MANKRIIINSGKAEPQYSRDVYIDISTITQTNMSNQSTGYMNLENHKIDKLVNVQSIFNSIHNIFTWIPGERILNPEFGTRLYEILYNGINTFTSEQIIAEIKTCVMMWEPRVNVIGVINSSDNSDTENNTIKLDVLFTIPSLDDKKYIYSYIQNRNGY